MGNATSFFRLPYRIGGAGPLTRAGRPRPALAGPGARRRPGRPPTEIGTDRVGQVGNLRRIGNPPGAGHGIHLRADCQSAAGYQPAPQKYVAFVQGDRATVLLLPL